MQEERLIRTNPPCAGTDLGGAPQLCLELLAAVGRVATGVWGGRDQLKGCRGHRGVSGADSCAGIASGKP